MVELKPCPFCGGKAKYVYSMPYNSVKCTKCKIFGKTIVDSYEQQDGKAKAINAWNKRCEEMAETKPKNPYWDNICKIAEKQRSKGVATYGCGIEDNPASILTRIEYLQEELIDGLMYCEWIKEYIRGFEDGK